MRLLSILLVIFLSCNNSRDLSMDELQTVKWDTLEPGIEYYSTSTGNSSAKPLLQFKVKSFQGLDSNIGNEGLLWIESLLQGLLDSKAATSHSGYIKINIFDIMNESLSPISIYVSDLADSTLLVKDLNYLIQYPGILDATYISKEQAKEKFITDGNDDWDKILTENPLPSSFEVKVNPSAYSEEWLKAFMDNVDANLITKLDISTPGPVWKEYKKRNIYIQYERYNPKK